MSLVALAAVVWLTPELLACPFCDGTADGGNAVKEAIFGSDFWFHLSAVALPFAIVAGVGATIHFGPPPWREPPRATSDGA